MSGQRAGEDYSDQRVSFGSETSSEMNNHFKIIQVSKWCCQKNLIRDNINSVGIAPDMDNVL